MIADISQKIFNLLIDITSFVYFIIEFYFFINHNVIGKQIKIKEKWLRYDEYSSIKK